MIKRLFSMAGQALLYPAPLFVLVSSGCTLAVLAVHFVTGWFSLPPRPDEPNPFPRGWSNVQHIAAVDGSSRLALVAQEGTVHLFAPISGRGGLYYWRFDAKNRSWAGPFNTAVRSAAPKDPVVVPGPGRGFHVVWREYTRDGLSSARYALLQETLQPLAEVRLFDPSRAVEGPDLAVDDLGIAHLAWVRQEEDGAAALIYAALDAGGESRALVIPPVEAGQSQPAIAVGPGLIHLAWVERSATGGARLAYAAVDLQDVQSGAGRLRITEGPVYLEAGKVRVKTPRLAAGPNGDIFIAYAEDNSHRDEAVHLLRRKTGSPWEAPVLITRTPSYVDGLTALLDNLGSLHLTWADGRANHPSIFYRRIKGPAEPAGMNVAGLNGDALLSLPFSGSAQPAMAALPGQVYVVWTEATRALAGVSGRDTGRPARPPLLPRLGLDAAHPWVSLAFLTTRAHFEALITSVFRHAAVLLLAGGLLAWGLPRLSAAVVGPPPEVRSEERLYHLVSDGVTLGVMAIVLWAVTWLPTPLVFSTRTPLSIPIDTWGKLLAPVLATAAATAFVRLRQLHPGRSRAAGGIAMVLWVFWQSLVFAIPYSFNLK